MMLLYHNVIIGFIIICAYLSAIEAAGALLSHICLKSITDIICIMPVLAFQNCLKFHCSKTQNIYHRIDIVAHTHGILIPIWPNIILILQHFPLEQQ